MKSKSKNSVNLYKKSQFFFAPKVARFLMVGCLNTLVGFFVFSLAIYLTEGNIGFSLAINIFVGIFFNYLSYGITVFKSLGIKPFAKFIFAYIFIYLINYIILHVMHINNVNIYLAQFINLFYLAPISYIIFNKWVFYKSTITSNLI
jgi:putative flippase GtrA